MKMKKTIEVCESEAFTLMELLVVLAVLAMLAVMLLPALGNTQMDTRAFQCQNNQRQIMSAWRMYADDNSDLLAPNDYPATTAFTPATASQQNQMRNWVVGTMEQSFDAGNAALLTNQYSLLSTYIHTPPTYRCPADNFLNPTAHRLNVRSYAMNSAVGTIWNSSFNSGPPIGSPVQGGWLNGSSFNNAQTAWQTYGKLSSIVRPSPANLFVLMDESPLGISSGSITISANASLSFTVLLEAPGGNHDSGGVISFADGHSIVHKWQDARTFTLQSMFGAGTSLGTPEPLSPADVDLIFLGALTSAPR
jgi:prepilin-type N-terminal cleavage/methylation domain-containing protein